MWPHCDRKTVEKRRKRSIRIEVDYFKTASYCLFRVGNVANEGEASAQHGECHSHKAVVPSIPKRLGQKSQAFGTKIPNARD